MGKEKCESCLEELKKKYINDRDKYTQAIVNSTSPRKLLVTGPGTGKTYTFSKVFDKKSGKKLALTLIKQCFYR